MMITVRPCAIACCCRLVICITSPQISMIMTHNIISTLPGDLHHIQQKLARLPITSTKHGQQTHIDNPACQAQAAANTVGGKSSAKSYMAQPGCSLSVCDAPSSIQAANSQETDLLNFSLRHFQLLRAYQRSKTYIKSTSQAKLGLVMCTTTLASSISQNIACPELKSMPHT